MALRFLNSGYFAGKVGIGTDSPSYTLATYASTTGSNIVASFGSGLDSNDFTAIGLSGFIASNGATKAGIALKRRGVYGTGELHFLNNTTLDNSDMTLSDSKMMIDQDGNLGIGTTTPSSIVSTSGSNTVVYDASSVNGQDSTSTIKIANRSTSADTFASIDFNTNNNRVTNRIVSSHAGTIHTGFLAFVTESYDGTSGVPSEKMRITGTGNVGIGTDSPDSNLEVSSATGGILRLTSTDTAIATGDFIGKIEFKSNDASTGGNNVMGFISSVARNVGTRYALSFGTGDAAAAVERMRIENDGDVIIGGATPSAKLNIDGANEGDSYLLGGTGNARQLRFSTFATASPHAGHKIDATSINGAITLATGGSERMRVDSAGAIKFNDYGGGNKTGDVDYLLGVNSSGTILEANTATLPGGPYLPLSAGSGFPLTGDLIVSASGNTNLILQNPGGTGNSLLWWKDSSGGNDWYFGQTSENANLNLYNYSSTLTQVQFKTNGTVTFGSDIQVESALFSNQENTDIDSAAAEVVAQVSTAYTAAFFDFVIKKTTNVRSGTVYACHDGTTVEFTETSTNDLGDTSDVTLSVDISGTNMRLLATVTSDDWSVKSLIRAI